LYHKDVLVTRLIPDNAPATHSGTPVFVEGEGFINTTFLSCQFGVDQVKGTFISSDLILCFAPPIGELNQGDSAVGNTKFANGIQFAIVEVTNNGIDYTTNRRKFIFFNGASSGTYQPGRELQTILTCPRGAYCRDGASNFTLCPMGSYQPSKGQPACLRCPIGYFCPELGLPVPRICPAGFVCDVSGIEHTELPCPAGHFCLEGTASASTFCGDEKLVSNTLSSSLGKSERSALFPKLRGSNKIVNSVFGSRKSGCWDNATKDFGLQVSGVPARIWAERRRLPLDISSPPLPIRGLYCLNDSCMKMTDSDDFEATDLVFDYDSTKFKLRRPFACPSGIYCAPGTAFNEIIALSFSSPNACLESMYCPEASLEPHGLGECPEGFYCPFAKKIPCPIGTHCPRRGSVKPMLCPPGTFNGMVSQSFCTECPIGYICPGYGRIGPSICSPGFVCSKLGLDSPNQRCPPGFYCPSGTQTSDPFRNDTTLRPYPCGAGSYCPGNVGYDEVKENDFLYAQPCSEGFFCELASTNAKGSGLCPRGFTCSKGTALPRPTPKGNFAELLGTVRAAKCLPGTYAPTIQTQKCYPCAPGTYCDKEEMFEPSVCRPGTYQSSMDGNEASCMACSEGTWSKNLGLREQAECIKCPPGVVCRIKGTTAPCSIIDLPTSYEPVLSLDGVPVPEYEFTVTERPRPFSLHECLKLNDLGVNDSIAIDSAALHRNGFVSADISVQHLFQEYFFGELIPPYIDVLGRGSYLRPCDQATLKYSTAARCYRNRKPRGSVLYQRMVQYYGPQLDIQVGHPIAQGYGGLSYIDLPHSRLFDASYNCTPGFQLMKESLASLFDETEKVVYTDPANDMQRQRKLNRALDQFYSGTCEADNICRTGYLSQATPCKEGYVCDEKAGFDSNAVLPCKQGYYCLAGTAPDLKLTSPGGQFSHICPAGYVCKNGTGLGTDSELCPENYFCPTGTADPFIGSVADDSLARSLAFDASDKKMHVSYSDDDVFSVITENEVYCRFGVDSTLMSRYRIDWVDFPVSEKQLFFVSRANSSRFPVSSNLAIGYNTRCSRDHKDILVADTVMRKECDCVAQLLIIISTYRLWKCTAVEALTHESGQFFLWNNSIHHLSASVGRVPFDEDDGFGGRRAVPSLKKRIPINSTGFLAFNDIINRTCEKDGVGFSVQFTWSKHRSFDDYDSLKVEVRDEYLLQLNQIEHGQRSMGSIDPFVFDLNHAINLVEEYGEKLESYIFFREKQSSDVDVPTLQLNDNVLLPGRYDVCACQNMLKCPNGTVSKPKSKSIDDCKTRGDQVLSRESVIPYSYLTISSGISNNGGYKQLDGTDLAPAVLELDALEVAVITIDLTGLPSNMTYNDHYRISVYLNCSPCAPNYQCKSGNNTCCLCQSHSLPTFFDSLVTDSGFLDNKHQIIQLSITALEHVQLDVHIELLHGSYYRDFDSYFRRKDKSELHVYTPNKFNQRNQSDNRNRFTWMAVIGKEAIDAVPLDLPLNLPQQRFKDNIVDFENKILVDRSSDIDVGDKYYWQKVALRDNKRNETEQINGFGPPFNEEDDDGRNLTTSYSVADDFSAVSNRKSWWDLGDKTAVGYSAAPESFQFLALPYLPFFSNCKGYDSHVGISHLLDDHPACTHISYDDTITVNQYAFLNGPVPLSDFCLREHEQDDKYSGIPLSCLFEEDFQRAATNFRWYEAPSGAALFHITKNAISASNFEAKFEGNTLITRWGRSAAIENLLGTQELISVIVKANSGGFKNAIPRLVKLNLQYYQFSKGKKRLVKAEISFHKFCTTLRPKEFGGNARLLAQMLNEGIMPCEVDIRGNMKSIGYTLEVGFFPLNWVLLFNALEFDRQIYLGFTAVIGTISVGVASLLWCTSRLLTTLRQIPSFHGWRLAKLVRFFYFSNRNTFCRARYLPLSDQFLSIYCYFLYTDRRSFLDWVHVSKLRLFD